MSFNYDGATFLSFAGYTDVTARDQRFFEANEGITSTDVNDLLANASDRILTKLKATDWWIKSQLTLDSSLNGDVRNVPAVDPDNILAREQDFKDLNVYFVMAEYLLPRVADWSTEADTTKIKFYKDQFDALFKEIIEDGSWYDFDIDGTIELQEKIPVKLNLVRIR